MRALKAGGEIKITDSYLHRESIKEIIGRRWASEDKAWYVPLNHQNIALLQLLGAEIDEHLKESVKSNAIQSIKEDPTIHMPIRAAPYAHQIEAFNFAMKVYGITNEEFEKGGDAK